MDPDETLRIIRALIKQLRAEDHAAQAIPAARIASRLRDLAELVDALDEWLTGGGFLPENWQHA